MKTPPITELISPESRDKKRPIPKYAIYFANASYSDFPGLVIHPGDLWYHSMYYAAAHAAKVRSWSRADVSSCPNALVLSYRKENGWIQVPPEEAQEAETSVQYPGRTGISLDGRRLSWRTLNSKSSAGSKQRVKASHRDGRLLHL
jgi:hypothetical protein